MKHRIFLITSCIVLIALVSWIDRRLCKANHGFCLHVIEAPIPSLPDPNPPLPFPHEILSQPFHYLGRGAQSFVFESQDQSVVLKFYRYPSHLRRFPWVHHPFGYLFSSTRRHIKEYNRKRLQLSFHSFFLAATPLSDETGVLYVHLQPTSHLHQKVQLIDRLGSTYHLPLDLVAFVVQKKGTSFLPLFKHHLALGNTETCKQMLDGLIAMITKRCRHHITDLDDMHHDNYGWSHTQAMHLDIGRFQEKESLADPHQIQQEILRVTSPLLSELERSSPELHAYFLEAVASVM